MRSKFKPGTLVVYHHPSDSWTIPAEQRTIGVVLGPAPGYDPEVYSVLFGDKVKAMDMDFLMEVETCTTYTHTKK